MAKRKFILTKAEQKELLHAYPYVKMRPPDTVSSCAAVREGYPETENTSQPVGTSLMEWSRAYREDHSQGLVDKRVGGNRAKLSKLQMEELQQILHQYTSKERLGSKAESVDGQYWSVEDVVQVVRDLSEVYLICL